MPDAADTATHSDNRRWLITTIVAIGGALIYAGFTAYLLHKVTTGNTTLNWDHTLVLYNGIASIGFSCIGVLLGTTVQQVSLAGARADTANAKADASSAKLDAADKANTIKNAMSALEKIPADLGGGAGTPAAEAFQILKRGLK